MMGWSLRGKEERYAQDPSRQQESMLVRLLPLWLPQVCLPLHSQASLPTGACPLLHEPSTGRIVFSNTLYLLHS